MIFHAITDRLFTSMLTSFIIGAALLIFYYFYRNPKKPSSDPALQKVKALIIGMLGIVALAAGSYFGMEMAWLRPITINEKTIELRGATVPLTQIETVDLVRGTPSAMMPETKIGEERFLVLTTYDKEAIKLSERDYPVDTILAVLKTKLKLTED